MKFSAKGTRNSFFELQDEGGTSLGKLDYTSWFSIKAEIQLPEGKTYHLNPQGAFHTSVSVFDGERKEASLRFNWKGQIIIELENGSSYAFKRVGFFNYHFGVINEHEHETAMVHQHFKIAEFSFNYQIETDDNYPEMNKPEFLLLLIYCCNYLHSRVT